MNAVVRHPDDATKTSFEFRPGKANAALPRVNDPFARNLPALAQRPIASSLVAKKKQQHGHPFLRAVVAGAHARALVDDGSIRIVEVGDTVDGSRVVDIEPDGVVLSDRRRLGFGETTR